MIPVAPPRQPPPTLVAPQGQPPQAPGDALIHMAEQLTAGLRALKGDTALALWLFNHAGGQAALDAFVQQARKLELDPDNPEEQQRLVALAPTAARLLEAAGLLVSAHTER